MAMDETVPLSDDAIVDTALAWIDGGQKVSLATVVSTWGSAPRPTGSQMAINDSGDFVGSVSGGCIEGSVIHSAMDAAATGASEVLEFGVSNSEAWEVGLACGGKIKILITPLNEERAELLRELSRKVEAKKPTTVITDLGSYTQALHVDGTESEISDAANMVLLSDKAQTIEIGDAAYFLNPFNTPLRLFVVGAVHIAQPLATMAKEAGFEVSLIDPREAFASPTRFPGYAISHDWPDEALNAAELDHRSAVVTLTHDPKIDDPALQAALKSDCFYIGSLGSTKTHGARLKRLEQSGFSEERRARIHGPVGLDIGAKSPSEIAVSILAEIIEVLRSPRS